VTSESSGCTKIHKSGRACQWLPITVSKVKRMLPIFLENGPDFLLPSHCCTVQYRREFEKGFSDQSRCVFRKVSLCQDGVIYLCLRRGCLISCRHDARRPRPLHTQVSHECLMSWKVCGRQNSNLTVPRFQRNSVFKQTEHTPGAHQLGQVIFF